MKKNHTLLFASLAILAAAMTTASCEKINSSTSDEIQQKILDAWIRINHSGLTASDNGIYTLSSTEGTGRQLEDSLYVFVKYSARTLDGTYTDYNYEDIAKQLGKFSYSTYYTYDIWYISESTLTDGLNEVLKKMKVGGKLKRPFRLQCLKATPQATTRSIIIPPIPTPRPMSSTTSRCSERSTTSTSIR